MYIVAFFIGFLFWKSCKFWRRLRALDYIWKSGVGFTLFYFTNLFVEILGRKGSGTMIFIVSWCYGGLAMVIFILFWQGSYPPWWHHTGIASQHIPPPPNLTLTLHPDSFLSQNAFSVIMFCADSEAETSRSWKCVAAMAHGCDSLHGGGWTPEACGVIFWEKYFESRLRLFKSLLQPCLIGLIAITSDLMLDQIFRGFPGPFLDRNHENMKLSWNPGRTTESLTFHHGS